MSYLVLARKWRPQVFEQIKGQAHIVRALTNAIRSGRIAHAYIFTGTRGVGKTSAARVFAKALNCAEGPTAEPCNRCDACIEIAEGRYPDVMEIDGASNNSVDDVRRLREGVRYPPVSGRYRVYIIDEVHMLSTGAFNALLKTLEEPPPQVVFIFATTDPHKVPTTILSRCQQYDFKSLSVRELGDLLSDICGEEGIEIDPGALMSIAREASGSVRDAQSLLDQVVSYAGQKVGYSDVQDVLGVVDRRLLMEVARSIIAADASSVVEKLNQAETFGFDVKRFALDLLDLFRDLVVFKAVEDPSELTDLTDEEAGEVAEIAENVSWEDLHARFDMLSQVLVRLRTAPKPFILLEMTLLKMAKLPPLIPLGQLGESAAAIARGIPAAPKQAPARTLPPVAKPVEPPMEKSAKPTAASQMEKPAQPPVQPPVQQQPVPQSAPAVEPSQEEPPPVELPPIESYSSATGSTLELVSDELVSNEVGGKDVAPVEEEKGEGGEAGGVIDGDGLWQALIAGLPALGKPLSDHGRLVSWDPDKGLVLEVEPDHSFIVKQGVAKIKARVEKVAGVRVPVEIRVTEGGESSTEKARRETDLARKNRRDALDHKVVRKVMDDMGGEIDEVTAHD